MSSSSDASWKRFTPETIQASNCLARTWADGRGGQCPRHPASGSEFCVVHGKGEKWKVHGRVDGPIPEKKLAEFIKASSSASAPRAVPKPRTEAKAKTESPPLGAKETKQVTNAMRGKSFKLVKQIDPNMPKRLVGGAFGCFLDANRQAFLKECAGQGVTAVTKMASVRWKALSQEDKVQFDEAYVKKKAAYEEAMKSYVPSKEPKQKQDKKEDKKDPNMPQKVKGGAYGLFLEANRPTFQKECAALPPSKAIIAIVKMASTRWKALSAENKAAYEQAYAQKKTAYEEAMKTYLSGVAAAGTENEKADAENPDCEDPDVEKPPPAKKAKDA